MKQSGIPQNNQNLSDHVRFYQIDKRRSLLWNSYFPLVVAINTDREGLKEILCGLETRSANLEVPELKKYKIVYEGPKDPYREQFIKLMEDELALAKNAIHSYFSEKKPYTNLYILNDSCNLRCPYCITRYNSLRGTSCAKVIRENVSVSILRQFLRRLMRSELSPISICFNGGEILLDWEFVRRVVRESERICRGKEIKYSMNTNMTLMNEGIAKFMAKHNFEVHVSIDGYEDAHNASRKYPNGNGSFNDVIRGLTLYRVHNPGNRILGFQGTINHRSFEPRRVYEMKKYGFRACRLSPNLLGTSKRVAHERATLMEDFLRLNAVYKFKVSDIYLSNIEKLLNMKTYRFSFNCLGLGCIPNMGLSINITKMLVSCMCSFVDAAAVTIDSRGIDIYDPRIGEAAISFIEQRLGIIKAQCIDCAIVGVCKGGCILNGIDNKNRINESACEYQYEMWLRSIKLVYERGRQ